MFDPLRIAYDTTLLIQLKLGPQKEIFQCTHYTRIDSDTPAPVARYTLRQIKNNSTVILEVTKDKRKNFRIKAFQMVEKRPFSPKFAMLLGTEAITFTPKNHPAKPRTIYGRIPYPDEKTDIIKYICDTEELPLHPWEMGYTRDGNGNWYQLLEQSRGRLKRFTDNSAIRCWEYADDDYTRLLIEKEETAQEESKDFLIYLGKTISRAQIHLLNSASTLSKAI